MGSGKQLLHSLLPWPLFHHTKRFYHELLSDLPPWYFQWFWSLQLHLLYPPILLSRRVLHLFLHNYHLPNWHLFQPNHPPMSPLPQWHCICTDRNAVHRHLHVLWPGSVLLLRVHLLQCVWPWSFLIHPWWELHSLPNQRVLYPGCLLLRLHLLHVPARDVRRVPCLLHPLPSEHLQPLLGQLIGIRLHPLPPWFKHHHCGPVPVHQHLELYQPTNPHFSDEHHQLPCGNLC